MGSVPGSPRYQDLKLTTSGQAPIGPVGCSYCGVASTGSPPHSNCIAYHLGVSLTPDRHTPSVADRDQPALRECVN